MSTNNKTILAQKDLLIIFTYASTGFGHLRVTDALYDGLENKDNSIFLDVQSHRLNYLHRLSSIHPLVRRIFEWTQYGFLEEIIAILYRAYLHLRKNTLYKRITTVLDQRRDPTKTLLVISTHFGLTHQFGSIKKKLWEEHKIKMYLIVQVTDDSPQKIWYVPEADIIFTPSQQTKETLLAYGKSWSSKEPRFEVIPYPINPLLASSLSENHYQERVKQLSVKENLPIQVLIPISGAAVGLDFFMKLTQLLYQKNPRFKFHVLVKKSLYTDFFVSKIIQLPFINLHVFPEDRQMINQYEKIYQEEQISIEITKPSEQAFKALLSSRQVGGSILLFTRPVGRQEYDNLQYLRRNKLIPSKNENVRMWKEARENSHPDFDPTVWRGAQLQDNPKKAAQFIDWMMRNGVLQSMLNLENKTNLDSKGVEKFWEKIADFLDS